MSDSIIKLIICAFGGLLASEGVVRLIGKFKYGIWAAILPPATWLEIIKKIFRTITDYIPGGNFCAFLFRHHQLTSLNLRKDLFCVDFLWELNK